MLPLPPPPFVPVPVVVPVAALALFQFHTAAQQRPTGDLVKGASSASPFVKFYGLAVRQVSVEVMPVRIRQSGIFQRGVARRSINQWMNFDLWHPTLERTCRRATSLKKIGSSPTGGVIIHDSPQSSKGMILAASFLCTTELGQTNGVQMGLPDSNQRIHPPYNGSGLGDDAKKQ